MCRESRIIWIFGDRWRWEMGDRRAGFVDVRTAVREIILWKQVGSCIVSDDILHSGESVPPAAAMVHCIRILCCAPIPKLTS